ncbi:MAG: tetratricopeptide repeat protein [Candidatus Accumulibacter sp.]|nr:tetratricopeptide repeat protein [Accumulibacter sp.]
MPTLSRNTSPRLMRGAVLVFLLAFFSLARGEALADVQALMKAGELPQALAQIDRYIVTRPKDAQGLFTKGLILSEMGRPQEAIQVFSKLTETFPKLPEPYNNLAVLYAQQKRYDEAQAALEMAIRTHPSYAIAHENLGDVYAKLASQAYGKALQLDSDNKAAQGKLEMIRELVSLPPARSGVQSVAVAAKTVNEPMKTAAVEPPKPPAPTPIPSAETTAPKPSAPTPTPPVETVASRPVAETATASRTDPGGKAVAEAGADDVKSEIVKIVRDWANAWSRKDVKAYLTFYARDFQTPKGMTLKKWETERRQRIDKPGRLQVAVDGIEVSVSGDRATARFRQQYTSATFRSLTKKTLVFVKSEDGWRILQERVN